MLTDTSCGVIPVHVVDGQRWYLLVQHGRRHWGFPKGHPELGESQVDTARREFAEETGITDVEILEQPVLTEQYTFRTRDGELVRKAVHYFVGVVGDATVSPQPEEIHDWAWGTFEQTHRQLSFEEARRLLEQAEAYLAEHGE